MHRPLPLLLLLAAAAIACKGEDTDQDTGEAPPTTVLVSFNSGTTEGLVDGVGPNGGYGPDEAALSDLYYGDGLAWTAFVEDTRAFFARVEPDLVVFQEIFYAGDCPEIPPQATPGFVCEDWSPGDPTVAQTVLGEDWQVVCHQGKTDKCAAVRRDYGSFRGCEEDLCLDFLDGAPVDGCGQGSRIGRGVVDRTDGPALTLVNIHGSSGFDDETQACRVEQFRQVFVDLGDGSGEPAASGPMNLVAGDLNTDPGRMTDSDPSAAEFAAHVGEDSDFSYLSEVGPEATPSYAGLFNIDHAVSDTLTGSCVSAGLDPSLARVTDAVYFDHLPLVCTLTEE